MTQRSEGKDKNREGNFPGLGFGMILRRVSTNSLAGLMEALAAPPYVGKADLPDIAGTLQMEIDELFPLAETLQLLRFVEVEAGDIHLTPAGKKFADGDVDTRKRMFGRHLLAYVLNTVEFGSAADGDAALPVYDAFRPDVVLLDIGLPGMDGYQVARRLREEPEFKTMTLCALTGFTPSPADRQRQQQTGFDHYYVKPVSLETLLELFKTVEQQQAFQAAG